MSKSATVEVKPKDPLTKTQQLLYDAYSIDYDDVDDLNKKMGEYWNHVDKNAKEEASAQHTNYMYMFTSRPDSVPKNFKSFPFIKKKGENEPFTNNDITNLNYLHRLVKRLHYRDPEVGARLITAIKDNDLRLANSMLDGFAPQDLIDEMIKIQGDIYKASGELKPTPKREREERGYDVPVVAASIHIDTSREGFEKARYDVSKLIRSLAKFSVDDENCDTPGKRLQGYHNSLYAKAQSTLNRLSHQQEAINEYRMRHIKREWDHYAVFCTMPPWGRLPPGYNPVPHTNSWITNSNTKFTKMNPALHEKLIKKKVWDLKDYLYFDPTLVTDNAGFEAWQRWAENEKRKYSIYCLEEFVKPDDWRIPKDNEEPNALEAIPVRFNKLRPFKDSRKKVKTPEKTEEIQKQTEEEYNGSSTDDYNASSTDDDKEMLSDSNDRAIALPSDSDDDEELIKQKEAERKREEELKQKEAERKRKERADKTKCKKSFDKRVYQMKRQLSKGLGEITENSVTKNGEEYTLDIKGMSDLLRKCETGDACDNANCSKRHPLMLEEAAKELLDFLENNKDSINKKLMENQIKKWIDKNKATVEKLIIRKANNRVTSVKQKGGEETVTDLWELLTGKLELSRMKTLRGDKEVISELVSDALMPYVKEPVEEIPVTVKDGTYTYKKGNDTYYLRFIAKKDEEKSHDNFIYQFDSKLKKGEKFQYLIPVERHEVKQLQGNVITTDNKKFTFKNTDGNPAAIPANSEIRSFYTQKSMGQDLLSWMEKKYYQFEKDNGKRKKDKNKLYIVDDLKNLKNEDLKSKVFGIIKKAKEAVDEFHDKFNSRFVHHDVKLENMTIDNNEKVRLLDYDNVIDTTLTLNDCHNGNIVQGNIGNSGTERNMDRFNTIPQMKKMLGTKESRKYVDYHQWGLNALRLGGVFDLLGDYNFKKVETTDPRLDKPRTYTNGKLKFWDYKEDNVEGAEGINETNFWKTVLGNKNVSVERSNVHITNMRSTDTVKNWNDVFNLSKEAGEYVYTELFKTSTELYPPDTPVASPTNSVQSPMQFISRSRQPVFERVQIESDYGDEEDLQALMEYDPLMDGEKYEDSVHISDAEFDRMLNEATDYDALNKHIERENKAYSDHSTEVEEDAKSVSSKHSNVSEVSVASQMSNMSSNSVASNMSAASNISAASNMSAHSVASNLSAASEQSNMSEMSNHSYASHHSMESEEAYPTSEHSNGSYGKYSEQSYNQTSSYGNSSSHSSSESSGKELGYSNGLSESSDHGMSESSDHESSNESMGYSSSGGSSSNNHSYNSSSDTES